MALCLSMSVCHKSVFCRNVQTDRTGFFGMEASFDLHCVYGKFPLVSSHLLPFFCFPSPFHAPSLLRSGPYLQYYLDSLFEKCYLTQLPSPGGSAIQRFYAFSA